MAFTKIEQLSFRQICLKHLQKILELSTVEFRGGYYNTVFIGTNVSKQYVPNSMDNYIQAIESFAIILIPHFDKDMKKDYKQIKEKLVNIPKDLRKEIETKLEEKFKKQQQAHKENPSLHSAPDSHEFEKRYDAAITNSQGSPFEQKVIHKKMYFINKLFEALNCLLKRNDYLKSAIYSEGDIAEAQVLDSEE